jgi:hypothetical protein
VINAEKLKKLSESPNLAKQLREVKTTGVRDEIK